MIVHLQQNMFYLCQQNIYFIINTSVIVFAYLNKICVNINTCIHIKMIRNPSKSNYKIYTGTQNLKSLNVKKKTLTFTIQIFIIIIYSILILDLCIKISSFIMN